MGEAESRTFCTSFLSLRKFVEETHGAGSFKRVREELSRRHDFQLPAVITLGSWLPTRHFTEGMNVARDLFGPASFQGSGAKRYMKGTLYDFGVVDGGYCDSLRAWVQRACMMTGADKIEVRETACRARTGAAGCTFEGDW